MLSTGMLGKLPVLFCQVNEVQSVVHSMRNTCPGVEGVF